MVLYDQSLITNLLAFLRCGKHHRSTQFGLCVYRQNYPNQIVQLYDEHHVSNWLTEWYFCTE